jgi:DNA gyrase subunit A
MLFSDAGKAVRFAESEVRAMGRTAAGVRGMRLMPGQQVISMIAAADESLSVLTATQNGYGKRTQIAEYTRHGRGAQGMIAIQCSERNGKLVTAQLVSYTDEIVLITTGGVLIRTRVSEIREAGRSTQGVRLINLDDNETLAGLVRLAEPPEVANGEAANGEHVDDGAADAAPPASDPAADEGPDESAPDDDVPPRAGG